MTGFWVDREGFWERRGKLSFQKLTGLTPTFLCLGRFPPHTGDNFTAVNGALQDQPSDYNDSDLKGGLLTYPNTTSSWEAPDADFGNIDADTILWVVVFKFTSPGGSNRNIIGNRELSSPNNGYEMYLNASDEFSVTVDGAGGAVFRSGSSTYDDNTIHTAAIRFDLATDELSWATELETDGPVSLPSGDKTCANILGIGDQRITTAVGLEIGLAAMVIGNQSSGVDLSADVVTPIHNELVA